MSDPLTFICVLEANLALSCVPSARRWPLRLFIPKWTVRRSAFLSKADWSWGYVSALDSQGRTIWIADAHRDDGQRFVVRAEEKLTAFVELEAAISGKAESLFTPTGLLTLPPEREQQAQYG